VIVVVVVVVAAAKGLLCHLQLEYGSQICCYPWLNCKGWEPPKKLQLVAGYRYIRGDNCCLCLQVTLVPCTCRQQVPTNQWYQLLQTHENTFDIDGVVSVENQTVK